MMESRNRSPQFPATRCSRSALYPGDPPEINSDDAGDPGLRPTETPELGGSVTMRAPLKCHFPPKPWSGPPPGRCRCSGLSDLPTSPGHAAPLAAQPVGSAGRGSRVGRRQAPLPVLLIASQAQTRAPGTRGDDLVESPESPQPHPRGQPGEQRRLISGGIKRFAFPMGPEPFRTPSPLAGGDARETDGGAVPGFCN